MQDILQIRQIKLLAAHKDKAQGEAEVKRFYGFDDLGRMYNFQLEITCSIDFFSENVVGNFYRLVILQEDGGQRVFYSGIATSFIIQKVGKKIEATFSLSSPLVLLDKEKKFTVFVDKKIPEIIEETLKGYGNDLCCTYSFQLSASYQPEPFVLQYNETDYNFILRLMEQEGMYLYFRAGEKPLFIITDAKEQTGNKSSVLRYKPFFGNICQINNYITNMKAEHKLVANIFAVKGHDCMRPKAKLYAECKGDIQPEVDIYQYDESLTLASAVEKRLRLLSEQALCRKITYAAETLAAWIQAGHVYSLEENPKTISDEILVTRVEHFWAYNPEQKTYCYHNKIAAISGQRHFRLQAKIPIPQIENTLIALTLGSAESKYATVDKKGRYKVCFNFSGKKFTAWVAKSEPYSGEQSGMRFPLLKDTGVIIAFMQGHPHRPVILSTLSDNSASGLIATSSPTTNRIRSARGHEVLMEDNENEARLQVFNQAASINLGHISDNLPSMSNDIYTRKGKTMEDVHFPPSHPLSFSATEKVRPSGLSHKVIYPAGLFTYTDYSNKHVDGFMQDEVIGKKIQKVYYDYDAVRKVFPHIPQDGVGYEEQCYGISHRTVTGSYDEFVKDNYTKRVDKLEQVVRGDKHKVVRGISSDFFIGVNEKIILQEYTQVVCANKNTFVCGLTDNIYLGAVMPVVFGITFDIRTGLNMAIDLGARVESKNGFSKEEILNLIRQGTINYEISNAICETSSAYILSVGCSIFH